jgi:hypothetical protein
VVGTWEVEGENGMTPVLRPYVVSDHDVEVNIQQQYPRSIYVSSPSSPPSDDPSIPHLQQDHYPRMPSAFGCWAWLCSMEFQPRRGPVVYAERAGEAASVRLVSGSPVRVVCCVAQTYSHLVLLADRGGALVLDAAAILLVIVPTLLG